MYFGILKKLKKKNLSQQEVDNFLKEKGVINEIRSVASAQLNLKPKRERFSFLKNIFRNRTKSTGSIRSIEKKVKIDLNSFGDKIYYSEKFKKELYYYITDEFKNIINTKFQKLVEVTNNVLETSSNETIIQEKSRSIFIEVFRDTIKITAKNNKILQNVDRLPEQKNYFQQLKIEQEHLINSLTNFPELLDCYLNGNGDIIEEELVSSCKVIEEIIEFDYKFKFLLALNKKYEIEDASNIIDEKYIEIYSKYENMFKSVEVAEFTYKKIVTFNNKIPAHISSLYFALFERNLITKNKQEFQRYVENIHGIKFGKIRKDNSGKINPHQQRVNQFLKDIDAEFPPKKA